MRATSIDDGPDICISNARAKQIMVFINDSFILNHTAFAYYSQPLLNYVTNINIHHVNMLSVLMLLNLHPSIRKS